MLDDHITGVAASALFPPDTAVWLIDDVTTATQRGIDRSELLDVVLSALLVAREKA